MSYYGEQRAIYDWAASDLATILGGIDRVAFPTRPYQPVAGVPYVAFEITSGFDVQEFLTTVRNFGVLTFTIHVPTDNPLLSGIISDDIALALENQTLAGALTFTQGTLSPLGIKENCWSVYELSIPYFWDEGCNSPDFDVPDLEDC